MCPGRLRHPRRAGGGPWRRCGDGLQARRRRGSRSEDTDAGARLDAPPVARRERTRGRPREQRRWVDPLLVRGDRGDGARTGSEMGLNQLWLTEHRGRRAVRKRYAIDDPRLFRYFGTGARNEALLKSRLGDLIPTELSAETSPDGYDEVCLEWRDGRSLEPHEFDGDHAHATGLMLARIHALTGAWYGSIDGRHRFERQ